MKPGGTIVEGTAGNTGIGLTLVGNARGYRSVIVMPETQSKEKIDFLRMIGADLRLVPAKPYRDPGNYVHVSRRLAEETRRRLGQPVRQPRQPRGPPHAPPASEIWEQTDGKVDAFTCACGTGGTLAGVAMALKERNPKVRIVLADPRGQRAVRLGEEQRPVDRGQLDHRGHRQFARHRQSWMARRSTTPNAFPTPRRWSRSIDVLIHEGLSVGTSSGINIAAAIRVAKALGPGHTVVTILADGGSRYQSKLFNPEFLRSKNLPVPEWMA